MSSFLSGFEHIAEAFSQLHVIKVIAAAVIFVLALVFKNQLSSFLSTVICRILFRKSEKVQKSVIKSIHKPLSYFVVVLAAYTAVEMIFPADTATIKALVLLKLCFIILSAWFAINFINSDYEVKVSFDISNSRKTALKFINNTLRISIITIAILLILEQFGISASKLFAALGIGGVAVAFACKDIVENMLSGFIIIFDKPFEVGDFIEINGEGGSVADIKIRTTRLIGVDGCEKVYPNTVMANSSVTNWTKMSKRAVSQTVAVTYSTSSDKLFEICDGIKELLAENENVLQDDIRVNFTDFGNHALEISLFFYVDKVERSEYLIVKNNINLALKQYFEQKNVELAFESKTLYFGDELKIQK